MFGESVSEAEFNEKSTIRIRIIGFVLFLAQLVYVTFFVTSAYMDVSNKIERCHQDQASLSRIFNDLALEIAGKRESIFYVAELKRRVDVLEKRCGK
jgi:hypothetical protein